MRVKSSYNGLVVPSLIWIAALTAAVFGAFLRGVDLAVIWPLALTASVPAIIGLILTPILRKEWAQLLVMFAWLTLAIIGCLTVGFIPMAMLFLCAPAAAALFEKEKVVEALVMGAIIAALIYFAGRMGQLPQTSLNEAQLPWGKQAGLMATLGLIISTLLMAVSRPIAIASSRPSAMSSSVECEMLMNAIDGAVLRFNNNDYMMGANDQARKLFGIPLGTAQIPLTGLISHDDDAQSAIGHLIAAARKSGSAEYLRLETRFEADKITYHYPLALPGDQDM